jgi:hypothetical protein
VDAAVAADHPQVSQVRTNPTVIRTRTAGPTVTAVCMDVSILMMSLFLVVLQENKKDAEVVALDGA